jgi:predicted nucleic acid-binding Zn ribbon protein
MQCPFCSSELKPDAVSCKKCGAFKVNQRTTVGVFVGWVGMVIGLIWIMMWIPLLFLPFIGYDMSAYPWLTLIVGTIVAAGLLWYSRSTLHSRWICRED